MSCNIGSTKGFFPRRAVFLVALFLVGGTFAGCGGTDRATKVPDWYTNRPKSPNYVFAAQSATSQKMQLAVDKATTGARTQLATNLEAQVQQMNKSFIEELSGETRQQFVQTQKTVTSRVLRGTSAAKKKILQKDNGTYRAFVLMQMPIGKAAEELMSKVKQNEEMYTRFRASQAFKEMQKAIKKYKRQQKRKMSRRKGSQGGGSQ